MHRNSVTGWPLLQLSLFTPEFSEYPKQRYQLALGGGPCHHFPIAFFNLARLLVKIPGKFFAQSAVHQNIEKSHLLAGNFQAFLFHFKINLTSIGIEIESKSGMETWIKSSEWDASKLTAALLGRYFKFPFKDKSQKNIIDYAHWYYNPVYTAKQINDELDPEVATFAEGQIYVDFGKFLEKAVNDPQIKEFFELIFKVKEFQALQKSNEQLKPDENKDKAEDTIEEILEIVPSLSALYQSIENLRVYGSKLPNKFIGDHVDWLVQSLNAQANQMNKMISTQAVTVEEVEQFKSEFKALLHSKDDLMSEHRILWKPIIANVLLCLASFGLGLIAIAIKTGFGLARSCKEDKKLAASGMLFFAETHREKLISAIEQEVPMIESALTF